MKSDGIIIIITIILSLIGLLLIGNFFLTYQLGSMDSAMILMLGLIPFSMMIFSISILGDKFLKSSKSKFLLILYMLLILIGIIVSVIVVLTTVRSFSILNNMVEYTMGIIIVIATISKLFSTIKENKNSNIMSQTSNKSNKIMLAIFSYAMINLIFMLFVIITFGISSNNIESVLLWLLIVLSVISLSATSIKKKMNKGWKNFILLLLITTILFSLVTIGGVCLPLFLNDSLSFPGIDLGVYPSNGD